MAAHKEYQTYIFSEEKPSEGFEHGFPRLLFNQSAYLLNKGFVNLRRFSIWNKLHQIESARIYFVQDPKQAISLPHSPFGSIEPFEILEEDVLVAFVHFISSQFGQMRIVHYPAIYGGPFSFSSDVFLKAGWNASDTATGHYLPVGEPFENLISGMELRKLKKAIQEGFGVTRRGMEDLKKVFLFIEQCRREKNQALSLDFEELEKQVEANPDRYLLFCVTKDDEMAAATIVVRVSSEVIYHFYPATNANHRAISPMVLLTKGLYDFCRSTHVQFVDLGTSMLNNLPNESLIYFKEQLGGIAYQKHTFIKPNLP